MMVLLTGVACVGKSTIGRRLAEKLGFLFFDLDMEIEKHYGKSIERLRAGILTEYSWRLKGSPVLENILSQNRHTDIVVAMPPTGLRDAYLRVIKKFHVVVIVLTDRPENILKRICFYDIDSKPIAKTLTEKEKKYYLSDFKKDITYYRRSYERAHFQVDIEGMSVEQAAEKLKEVLGYAPTVEKPKPGPLREVPTRTSETAVTHINRKRVTYYLHVGKTKTGKPRYYFSTKTPANTASEIPEGYEIYENPNAQVFSFGRPCRSSYVTRKSSSLPQGSRSTPGPTTTRPTSGRKPSPCFSRAIDPGRHTSSPQPFSVGP